VKVLFIFLLFPTFLLAQHSERKFHRVAVHYGTGNINNFLFNDTDYAYKVEFRKVQLYYRLKRKKLNLDLLFQPEWNTARHELLNYWFVNTDAEREEFMQEKKIEEYILNLGVVISKEILPWLEVYALGSIGPGYFDTRTERLAKGFAFSDNIALGINLGFMKNWSINIQPSFRHVSNANLKVPNGGYNSLNIEAGLANDF
tara:strand:+ start:3642 stop:4244 length:603 start_codon:yes stop_codon:yes gene_type:complete